MHDAEGPFFKPTEPPIVDTGDTGEVSQNLQDARAEKINRIDAINKAFEQAAVHVINFSQLEQLRDEANKYTEQEGSDPILTNSLENTLYLTQEHLIETIVDLIFAKIGTVQNLSELSEKYSIDAIITLAKNEGVPEGIALNKIVGEIRSAVSQREREMAADVLEKAQETFSTLTLRELNRISPDSFLLEQEVPQALAKKYLPNLTTIYMARQDTLVQSEIDSAREEIKNNPQLPLIPRLSERGMNNDQMRKAQQVLNYYN